MKLLQDRLSKRGMLLLEAIMAIVILIVSVSVIIESLVSGLRTTVITSDYAQALVLMDNLMTKIMCQRTADSLAPEADFAPPNAQFHYVLKNYKVSDQPLENSLHEIELSISWQSGQKKQKISAITWLADAGNQNFSNP